MITYVDKHKPKKGVAEFSIHCLDKTQICIIETALDNPHVRAVISDEKEYDALMRLRGAIKTFKTEKAG